MPPCPGNIEPVSLTLAFLLKYEINKSPNWQINEIARLKNIISINGSLK